MCVNHGQWIKTVDGHWRPVMWPVRSVLGAPLAANKTNSQTLLINHIRERQSSLFGHAIRQN